MSAWAVWLVVICAVPVWLGVGFGIVAPRWITSEVERQVRLFPSSARDQAAVRRWRDEARQMCWGPALIWPLMSFRYLGFWAASRSELTGCEERMRADAMEQRIRELEREAGIQGGEPR